MKALDHLQQALHTQDPQAKCDVVAAIGYLDDSLPHDPRPTARMPGRPSSPELIAPRDVPVRGLGTPEGRAAMVHAIAHIEFNAINLALDACVRFTGLPPRYYEDWLSVARDEARHFRMLASRLKTLGYAYGDFPAHNGLWEAAEQTAHDVLERMALVPRVLEARGLDVTPGMIRRLEEVRDPQTAAVLRVILSEEVRHVAIGTHWYRWLCIQRGLDADRLFPEILARHRARIRAPINWPARLQAGFHEAELPAELLPKPA